jgi:site-specific DNA recombinase
MRVIGATRLSVDNDASTSIERQRDAIEHWAAANGHTVAGISEDLTSGATDPFTRSEMKLWLARTGDWDIIVVHKLDRLSRSLGHLNQFVTWCRDNGKILVSVSESIDMSTAAGRMFVQLLGVFAEFERERTSERRADHARKARQEARWDGRAVPPGYRPVKVNSHYELEIDPVKAGVIRSAAARIIAGESARQVATGTGSDAGTLIRVLRNESLRGYVLHDGQPVRDGNGMPVTRDAILDDGTWARLQATLDKNGKPGAGARQGASLLLGVLHCADCQQRLYMHRRGRNGNRYRHGNDTGPCHATFSATAIDTEVTGRLMNLTENMTLAERIDYPAESHETELAQVRESIAALDDQYEKGNATPETYARMVARLEARRDRLTAMPTAPARTEWRDTDIKFADHWAAMDTTQRRGFLLDAGVTATVSRTGLRDISLNIDWAELYKIYFQKEAAK